MSVLSYGNPELSNEALWKEIEKKHNLKFDVTDDPEEARNTVQELLEQGYKPNITVPEKYIEEILKNGIAPTVQIDKTGHGEHYSILAGRLGADPYFPKGEARYLVTINPKNLKIEPRFTRDKIFAGTVAITNDVPAEDIEVIGKFDQESFKKI